MTTSNDYFRFIYYILHIARKIVEKKGKAVPGEQRAGRVGQLPPWLRRLWPKLLRSSSICVFHTLWALRVTLECKMCYITCLCQRMLHFFNFRQLISKDLKTLRLKQAKFCKAIIQPKSGQTKSWPDKCIAQYR